MLDICTRALGARDRGNDGDAASLRYDPSKLAPIDKKLVEKPFKYTGDPKKFVHWVERMYNLSTGARPSVETATTIYRTMGSYRIGY